VADTAAGRTVATPIEASDHHDGSPGAREGGDETEAWQMKGTSGAHSAWLTNP
jgi:hypothetical protein